MRSYLLRSGSLVAICFSNIVLDELDRELERRGLRFARYADDCNIYVRSKRAGQRVMESITRFITHEAQAQGESEEECGGAARGSGSFSGSASERRIPEAADRAESSGTVQRADTGTDEPDQRSKHRTDQRNWPDILRGWLGYFGKCETPSVLEGFEQWPDADCGL